MTHEQVRTQPTEFDTTAWMIDHDEVAEELENINLAEQGVIYE